MDRNGHRLSFLARDVIVKALGAQTGIQETLDRRTPMRSRPTRRTSSIATVVHSLGAFQQQLLTLGGNRLHDVGVHGYSSVRGSVGATRSLCAKNVSRSSTSIVMRPPNRTRQRRKEAPWRRRERPRCWSPRTDTSVRPRSARRSRPRPAAAVCAANPSLRPGPGRAPTSPCPGPGRP